VSALDTSTEGQCDWLSVSHAHDYAWPPARQFGNVDAAFRTTMSPHMPELGVARVLGGRVRSPGGVIYLPDGRHLDEMGWDRGVPNPKAVPAPTRVDRHLNGVALVLATSMGKHYGHLVPDALSRLGIFEMSGGSLDYVDWVVTPWIGGSPATRELIERLGIAPAKHIELRMNQVVSADVLVAPSFPGLRRQYHPIPATRLRAAFGDPNNDRSELLFITRRGFSRNPTNLDEVEELARSLGFQIYEPSTDPNQIHKFRAARGIAGVSGSGLTNIAFCAPGTRIFEMMSNDHLWGYYYSMSGACGLDYAYTVGKAIGRREKPGGPSPLDIEFNMSTVRSGLDWVARRGIFWRFARQAERVLRVQGQELCGNRHNDHLNP
jgi:Glycosyltransferase 61